MEEIVRLLAHFAAELDKDAQEVQAGLVAGLLPPWVCPAHPLIRDASGAASGWTEVDTTPLISRKFATQGQQ